ncbi:MAG: hypothetical protein ABSA83_19880 [Verrucomicrobiota bacterium]|jgi:hypothetical protein
MNCITLSSRGAQISALCGLVLALVIAAGCGPTAPPSAPAKPKVEAPQMAAAPAAPANLAEQYNSVFEDLPPPKGKDPFFPMSHRREPVRATAESQADGGAPVEPVLSLKAVIGRGQAVINNVIFEPGEEQPVRVPNGHVRVRCINIASNSVLVQVEGDAGPKRLFMEQKKNN